MHWDYGWGMGVGWIFIVLFWLFVILGVIYLVKLIAGGPKNNRRTETAVDILKKRYARGEIGREEFEKKKKDLEA